MSHTTSFKKFFLLFIVLINAHATHAAFPIHTTTDTLQVQQHVLPSTEDDDTEEATEKKGSWAGIVALACGALGLYLPVLALPAIIFGAIGMSRKRRLRGLGIAGFVLGIIGMLIILLTIYFLTGF